MELCTTARAISVIPKYSSRLSSTTPTRLLRSKPSLPLRPTLLTRSCRGLHSRLVFTSLLPRATSSSEETSSGANPYAGGEFDSTITLEDVPPAEKKTFNETVAGEVPKEESLADEQTESFEILDKLNIKFDSDEMNIILLYGGGALVALWFASAIVGAIDSIPLFPKLMEVVGLGYTLWFSYRYLIFKKNREELAAKIEEFNREVLGLNDE
ncbi:protein CURVATURE THYLAKOID 1D, chloroplastic [Juglans microcarpa x Juglans regia]|uniref:protein CURVATURE THYLAKOID 1D, chloroplastic n=1 Tax=Juglans microcarpa x Juglans regia TaxID=2249226 RepID=UPI001B7ECEAD|nr:protein CURVATURE THYLAKOID 1D, chloroplastic [Juglans microcarpa x Juglans regia]